MTKFFISKEQVLSLIPLFGILKSLEGEDAKTYWVVDGKESKLIVSGNYFYLTYALPIDNQDKNESASMYGVDFEKIVKILQSISESTVKGEDSINIQVSINDDKMLFHDTGSARIKSRLTASRPSSSEQDTILNIPNKILNKFFYDEENHIPLPFDITMDENLYDSFKLAVQGITTTATRNNSMLLKENQCFYADLAQIYLLPGNKILSRESTDDKLKLHKTTLQLLTHIYETSKKLYGTNVITPQISSNNFYVYFKLGNGFEIMISQRKVYLDVPTIEQLNDISPIDNNYSEAVEITFNVDEMIKELKMFNNIPSQESKRWGAINVDLKKEWGNKIHLSLYDYVAEVETDLTVENVVYPEGFEEYQFLWSTKLVSNFLDLNRKSSIKMIVIPKEKGHQSLGILLVSPEGKKAIYPKFNGKSAGTE